MYTQEKGKQKDGEENKDYIKETYTYLKFEIWDT